jgi:hypothetical protein
MVRDLSERPGRQRQPEQCASAREISLKLMSVENIDLASPASGRFRHAIEDTMGTVSELV